MDEKYLKKERRRQGRLERLANWRRTGDRLSKLPSQTE